jgi:hypothetical protein
MERQAVVEHVEYPHADASATIALTARQPPPFISVPVRTRA